MIFERKRTACRLSGPPSGPGPGSSDPFPPPAPGGYGPSFYPPAYYPPAYYPPPPPPKKSNAALIIVIVVVVVVLVSVVFGGRLVPPDVHPHRTSATTDGRVRGGRADGGERDDSNRLEFSRNIPIEPPGPPVRGYLRELERHASAEWIGGPDRGRPYATSVLARCRQRSGFRHRRRLPGHRRLGSAALFDDVQIRPNDQQRSDHLRDDMDHGTSCDGCQHHDIRRWNELDAVDHVNTD